MPSPTIAAQVQYYVVNILEPLFAIQMIPSCAGLQVAAQTRFVRNIGAPLYEHGPCAPPLMIGMCIEYPEHC